MGNPKSQVLALITAAMLVAALPACKESTDTNGGGSAASAASGSSGGTGTSSGNGTAAGSATANGQQAAPAAPIPVIFIHGIGGNPVGDWGPVMGRLARGRQLVRQLYAGDSDLLVPGSIRRDSLIGFGYYRETSNSPEFYTDRLPSLPSIGGCPVPRTDAHASDYQIAYTEQLDRTVENICRVTGSERVDLVCFSMGGLVGRAYTRWLSLKAPNGLSRVRRLVTIGTMNHGLNALEAMGVALANNGVRDHVDQGEAAELNYQCEYWGGRSFIDRLNDGWDLFCQQHGVEYGCAYGYGNSQFHNQFLQGVMTLLAPLGGVVLPFLLVHPVPANFDVIAAQLEAMGDGDGVVRVDSSRMDPSVYPSVRFNARYYAKHTDGSEPERSMVQSSFTEAVIRRFILEGRTSSGFTVANAHVEEVDSGTEATWLRIDLDVIGGQPLAAQVLLRSAFGTFMAQLAPAFGVDTKAYGLLLRPGRQSLMLDPVGASENVQCEVRLYGLDGVEEVVPLQVALPRSGRPLAPSARPQIGSPTVGTAGELEIPLSSGVAGGEVSWLLDDGHGGTWSAFQPDGPLQLGPLAPGHYELRVRARSRANAMGLEVEDPRPDAIHIAVDGSGQVRITR